MTFTYAPTFTQGGSFFTVTDTGLTTPSTLNLTLVSSSCGSIFPCSGTVTVHPTSGGGSDVVINVSYSTSGGGGSTGVITASPNPIQISSVVGGANFGTVTLTTTSATAIPFSINNVTPASSWLNVTGSRTDVSSTASATLTVNANSASPTALAANTYTGSFTVTPTGGGTATTVSVTYVVGSGGSTTGSLSIGTNNVTLNNNTGQFFAVSKVSGTATNYYANATVNSGGTNWLLVNSATSTTGVVGSTLTISANTSGLATGTYYGTVALSDLANSADVTTISVTLLVNGGGGGSGSISPSSLTFSALLNGAAQSQDVTVTGTAPIAATIPDNCGWLGVTLKTYPNVFTIQVLPYALTTAGNYSCNIPFTANGTNVGTLLVTLNLGTSGGGGGTVSGVVAPTTLNFAYQAGGDSPPLQYVTVSGSGTYTISTSTSGSTNFISANGSGTAPGLIAVSVVGGLQTGTYSGAISIATSSGTQSVAVNLTVAGSAVVQASPGSFNISWQPGSGSSVNTLSIFASDGSAVPISVASSASWVTVAGVTSTSTPASAQVTINPAGLANGLNTATITVTATGAANTTVTIPVVALVSGSSGGGSGNLTLSASSLTFNAVLNGTQPASQTLGVSTNPTGTAFSATVPASGCGWLSVSPIGNLVTNQNLTVSVNQAGYAVNTYSCNITLLSGGLTQTVPVSMVVSTSGGGGGSGNVSVSPASLTFSYVQGGETPGLQGIVVSSASGSSSVGITTSVTSGSSWLSVTPTSVATPVTLSVTVNVTGLDAGTYNGNVRITPNGGTAVNVPVTLTVQSLTVTATPATLTFNYRAGDPAPAAQTVSVAGGTGLTFAASASSSGWLKVTPTTGTTPADLSVTVDPASLTTAGQQTGTITVTGTGTATGTATVTVTVNVTAPLPTISGVTNGASFAPSTTISAGEVITIFGTNIGPSTPVGLTLDSNGNVSNSIGGVQVLVGGYPSPMIYASGTQVSAVVPYEIASPVFRVSPSVQVKYLGQTSNGVQVTQVASVPGIFTANASGSGPGAILNSNNSVNSPSNPANKGDIVVIYMTGEGQTTPAGVSGKVTTVNPSGNPLTPQPLLPVAVLIDGQPAHVVFYGEAPGIVSGVMQVNVQIPATAATGNLSVSVQVGSNISQTGVTVSVK